MVKDGTPASSEIFSLAFRSPVRLLWRSRTRSTMRSTVFSRVVSPPCRRSASSTKRRSIWRVTLDGGPGGVSVSSSSSNAKGTEGQIPSSHADRANTSSAKVCASTPKGDRGSRRWSSTLISGFITAIVFIRSTHCGSVRSGLRPRWPGCCSAGAPHTFAGAPPPPSRSAWAYQSCP